MLVDIQFQNLSFKVSAIVTGDDGETYLIQDQLAQGGNAVVCECESETEGESLAIKFLTHFGKDGRLERFSIETRLMEVLSAARHDHLIRFVTSGNAEAQYFDRRKRCITKINLPFVIMERASCSLRDYVRNSTASIPHEIYSAQFRGLVSALEVLHAHAIHRDIKPDNILVVGERWVISDFGLCSLVAKGGGEDLTRHAQIPGPRFWMSPEANNRSVGLDDEITFASDVFQLAAVFWWVVNRRHPSGILEREDWTGLDTLYHPISTALQHSLGRRYGSAKDFGDAVVEAISI